MQYSDNPRKVYGKLKIVYCDGHVSTDIQMSESGKGDISYPEQVYEGHDTPTIRACTMDGNSSMGEGFQMNGPGLVCGWWSENHCNGNGEFIAPVWLRLTCVARPVTKWTIRGDDKLNQYPVDYDIRTYKESVLSTVREVRGNTNVQNTVYYEGALLDITAVEIQIYTWSTPNVKAKIIQFFDIVEEEYLGSDLKEIEVYEEIESSASSMFGISGNTLKVVLYNKDRKFDKGYLKELLLVGRKVSAYLGINNNTNQIVYTNLGIFYSDEWSMQQDNQWLKLQCEDRLMGLQSIEYIGYPCTINISLYEIAVDIFNKAGLAIEDYSIDTALQSIIVYNGFMRKTSVWNALQDICYAGRCNAFVNRENRIIITRNNVIAGSQDIMPASIFSHTKKALIKDFSNSIEVAYTEVDIGITIVVAYEKVIVMDAGVQVSIPIEYGIDITDANVSYIPSAGINLISFESGINAGKLVLENTNSSAITTTIKVEGLEIRTSTQIVEVEDSASISVWGKKKYSYIGSELIQDYDMAYDIGTYLLDRLKRGSGTLKMKWRGDPTMQLLESFHATDRDNDKEQYQCVSNNYKYDGGLIQETKGRLI